VLGATLWSLHPQRRSADGQTELCNVDRVSKSEGLNALPTDYSKLPPPDIPVLGSPLPGDLGSAIVNAQQPIVATYTAPGYDPNDALRKEAEAATSVFFRTNSPGQSAAAPAQTTRDTGVNTLVAFNPMAAGPTSTAVQPEDPTTAQNRQDQKEAFPQGSSIQTRNSGHLTLPSSPYQIMVETVITAILVTGIKSDLPGTIIAIATVTEPVYDTATGRFLLIPQGARILGRYNARSVTVKAASSCPIHRHLRSLLCRTF